MYGMARTRARRNRDRQNADKHKDWMDNWRSNPENVVAELKARVLNRVKKGSVPNVKSMAKYDITLEEVNLLRREYGYDPLIINVPMFLRERECGDIEGRVADNIPARSAIVEDIDQREDDEEEVVQSPRRQPLPQPNRSSLIGCAQTGTWALSPGLRLQGWVVDPESGLWALNPGPYRP